MGYSSYNFDETLYVEISDDTIITSGFYSDAVKKEYNKIKKKTKNVYNINNRLLMVVK